MGKWEGTVESVEVTADFWRTKRVFLTGHTGFKGSWLTLWLQQMGAQVTGYALAPNTTPSMFELAQVEEGITSHIADIRDIGTLKKAMAACDPEIVFHLAAQPLVRLSYAEPRETYETNVLGTVNVLDAIRATPGVRAAVMVTSDKCYENRELGTAHTGYRETDPMGGHDPYSNSKGCAELVTAAYRNSFFHPAQYAKHGVALASARAGNVIGGGDWCEDRLIPDFIRAITNRQPLRIRNPHATRPWQHVLEPLSGYLLLAEKLATEGSPFASAWNFGPEVDDTHSVEWIAERLTHHWGDGAIWQLDGSDHPHEANYLKLDSSKARNQLGWRPKLTLEESLTWLVNWYQQWHRTNKQPLRELTLNQIDAYQRAKV